MSIDDEALEKKEVSQNFKMVEDEADTSRSLTSGSGN